MMVGDRICGGVAPFQGLVSLSGSCCPRALPWAIALSPVGAEDQRPVGAMRWFDRSDRLPSGGGGEEDVHRLATRGYGWWWRGKRPPSGDAWLRGAVANGTPTG
jgi:hypothetical protein